MAKEFRIYTRVWDEETKDHHYAAVRVPGKALDNGLFAHRDAGRTLDPDHRWKISDIQSGTAISELGTKSPLRFASFEECKAWVENMPEEYKNKLEAVRASEKYKQICQDFENLPKE